MLNLDFNILAMLNDTNNSGTKIDRPPSNQSSFAKEIIGELKKVMSEVRITI